MLWLDDVDACYVKLPALSLLRSVPWCQGRGREHWRSPSSPRRHRQVAVTERFEGRGDPNCFINLAPDKKGVARVLKSGWRLAFSDIALERPLPPEVAGDLMAVILCVIARDLLHEIGGSRASYPSLIPLSAD